MEKQQFDELLGGTEKLPNDIHIYKFLAARGSEIAKLTHELENPQQTKRIFQKLPAYMRRRVMSHNARRLPRKLREIHIKQMAKAGLPPKTKTPSRKHRRRARNLLAEYNRRQRKKFWLETHIWHAKRFKIADKFGFKIPLHSNDRCFRANYRAIKSHCLLQDISYYTCVELTGEKKDLLDILMDHCDKNTLSFAAKCYANGEREGSLMFFRYKCYPKHPIGNIYFLWNPSNDSLSSDNTVSQRTLWIWIHPAFYNDIIKELIQSFNFIFQNNGDKHLEELEIKLRKQDWKDINEMPPMFELMKSIKTPVYRNANNCQMTILRNHLNRFRLYGPLALNIIIDALRCPKSEVELKKCYETDNSDTEMKEESNDKLSWYEQYYAETKNAEALKIQKEIIESMFNLTAGNIPSSMVLGLTVLDPRFYLPFKREKIVTGVGEQKRLLEPPKMANNSPLWMDNMRSAATKEFITSHQINQLRSQNLVPGVQNDKLYNENVMKKIPVILIQKTGTTGRSFLKNKSNGFSAGIDIILPSSWSMPFWLAFILRSAKPAGLRESQMICFESENQSSPDYYYDPDTTVYKREALIKKKELIEHYFKRPPNRRVNFNKYKVAEPFFCNWELLMKEWVGTSDYSVYRNYKALRTLQGCLIGMKMPIILPENEKELTNYLIPVKVTLINGGSPKDFAMICLPTVEDVQVYKRNRKWIGVKQNNCLDPFKTQRNKLRKKHRLLLLRLKRKRIRACKQIKEMYANPQVIKKMMQSIRVQSLTIAKKHIEEQAKIMAKLYLPEAKSVRFEGDRETFGYVTQGTYCYSNAVGVGLGYVVAKVLFDMINQKRQFVLVRNTTSKMYRTAKIEIIV